MSVIFVAKYASFITRNDAISVPSHFCTCSSTTRESILRNNHDTWLFLHFESLAVVSLFVQVSVIAIYKGMSAIDRACGSAGGHKVKFTQ